MPLNDSALLITLSGLFLAAPVIGFLTPVVSGQFCLTLAIVWIPVFAATVGRTYGEMRRASGMEGPKNGKRKLNDPEKPFQFGLSELLAGVFIVAVLMGICAVVSNEQPIESDYTDLWNFLCGSILAVTLALIISSYRTRSKAGWAVGLPIALGMTAHLIWGTPADHYVLLVWCLCGLYFGHAPEWKKHVYGGTADTPSENSSPVSEKH